MTGNYDDDDETNFQHKILLTVHKFQKLVKTFAKSSWANIKFLKTCVQLGGFLFGPSIQPIKEMTSLVNSIINSYIKE